VLVYLVAVIVVALVGGFVPAVLLAEVWGPGYTEAAGNLRLYMTQLRRKLEPDPARPYWLHTEPGMGYRYQPDAAPPAAAPGTEDGRRERPES